MDDWEYAWKPTIKISVSLVVVLVLCALLLCIGLLIICCCLHRQTRVSSASMLVFRRWLEHGAKSHIEPPEPDYYECLIKKVACAGVHDKQWLPLALEEEMMPEDAPMKRKGVGSTKHNGEKGIKGQPLSLSAAIRLPTKEVDYIMSPHAEEARPTSTLPDIGPDRKLLYMKRTDA